MNNKNLHRFASTQKGHTLSHTDLHHKKYNSSVLVREHARKLPGSRTSIGIYANVCILCTACFCFMSKHLFCLKYQYNKYMFNFIDIYSFIPMSDCVGRDLSSLLCSGPYNAAMTALSVSECSYLCTDL